MLIVKQKTQYDYYLNDIKMIMDDIDIFVEVERNYHYEIQFNDTDICSIVLENGVYYLDLIYDSKRMTKSCFNNFKYYLDHIIEYEDLKKFIKNLYKYYSTGRIFKGSIK